MIGWVLRLAWANLFAVACIVTLFSGYADAAHKDSFHGTRLRHHSLHHEHKESGLEGQPDELSLLPRSSKSLSLTRRDEYSCGPGNPCANGACCGKDGYCGYGPIYCGDGCVSNCDATAECGRFAVPSGKTCLLDTCCSEHGFCGTTKVR